VRSLYLSANLDAATRAQAEQWRPLGFIGKPFLPAEIVDAVERATKLVPGEKNGGN
jgi:two-component system, response regulator PdtaR